MAAASRKASNGSSYTSVEMPGFQSRASMSGLGSVTFTGSFVRPRA